LALKTNELLCQADASFPLIALTEDDFDIITEQAGKRYAVPTQAGKEAQELLLAMQNIELDTTYTAKTLAALIDDAKTERIAAEAKVLFWHTYCADHLPVDAQSTDYHQLPIAFHSYFK
jgi:D-cysteine desulfhydrase